MTALTLNRLAERDIDVMIDGVVGNKLLPASIRQDIIERTDGIPLFVEEMTKAVLEAESEGAARAHRRGDSVAGPGGPGKPARLADGAARPARPGQGSGADRGGDRPGVLPCAAGCGGAQAGGGTRSALDRLIAAGLLFRQGVPPHASYLFKHALVQDAAYGTLLREPRRALHARIAETLESQFAEIAENQPELLARHCTEAGLIEKAAALWGKAGQRSLERSALVEAIEQLTRALDQIATLPATPALRREQIKLQVALITPLIHVKGYAAPETKAAAEQARLLIEQAEALGEPPEDPLLLFSVLYGFWVASFVAFNGDAMRELAAQFLALAEKQGATVPLMIGHRIMGISLSITGDIAEGRAHYDRAIALYDPAEHRPLATRFGEDARVAVLCFGRRLCGSLAIPRPHSQTQTHALKDAREIGQAATLMFALIVHIVYPHCAEITRQQSAAVDELIALADEKGALFWKAMGMMDPRLHSALTGKAADAVQMITSGITA